MIITNTKYINPTTLILSDTATTEIYTLSLHDLFRSKADKSRGDLPIGVYWHERDQEYRAQCSYITDTGTRKNKWLGGHSNPEDAYLAYKRFKESHIKEIAERYKEYIPDKLYKALYDYQVEITD